MTEHNQPRQGFLWRCHAACALVSISCFQFGFDGGLIGGFQAMIGFLEIYGYPEPNSYIGWNITHLRQQLISSLMILGAFLSACAVGPLSSILGRKSVLWIACLLCSVSTLVMILTTSIGALYAGRLIIGLSNGLFYTASALYIQECAPAKFRGLVVSIIYFWMAFGQLIGTIVDNFTAPISGRRSYQIPLALIYIVPVFLSIGLFFIPESPRWLVLAGKEEEARTSLLWLRSDPISAEKELKEVILAVQSEKSMVEGVSVLDMFADRINRRRTVLAVCAFTTQAASGAIYIIIYGTYFFAMANIAGQYFRDTCILQGIGLFAIVVNNFLITKYGYRRVFLTAGLIICGLTQLIMAAIYTRNPGTVSTGKAVVALSILYLFTFNCFIGPYASVSSGELPCQRLRSYTLGVATAVGFLGSWLGSFTAPYFINVDSLNWGPKYGYIWAPSCWVAAFWVFLFLPEVKGRTLEEIDEMFAAQIPARKFKSYSCVGRPEQTEVGSNEKVLNQGS